MKKLLLLFILSFIVIFSFAQTTFPTYQPVGNSVTLWDQKGAVRGTKGIIVGNYTDTTAANGAGNYIKFYPGAQIFTTSDNGIWTRNSTATAWIQQGVGGSLVTTVTIVDSNHIQICTINGCDTITINNVVGPITNITILSDTTIQVCGSDVMSLPNCDTLQTIPTNYVLPNPLDNQCGLVPGTGVVTWDSLLKFDVSAARWKSCCDLLDYQTTFTVVTLAAADPSLPRIDAIVLDPTSGVTVVQGTPAADPAIPDISPCQVFLTAVLIQAASTVPSGIGQLTVYDENNGGEWIPATVTGVTADFVNTTSPAHLLKAIHWESGATGTRQIVFNAPTAININDYGILKLYIKLTTGIFGGYLMVDFPGATSFGIPLSSFGFNPTSAVGYQIISIPLNAFTFTNPTTVDQFRILVKGTTTAALDFYVDWVQFQSGINTPSSQKGITNVNVTGNHLFNPVLTYPFSNEVDIAFPLDGFLPVNLLDTADGNDGDFLKKVNGVWTPTADSSAIDTVYAKNWANARHGPVRDTIIFGSQSLDSSLLAYDTYAGLNGHFFAIQKDASTNRFKITPDSIYLASTLSGSVTGMVWKLKNAATGSGYWGTASGGGGINLYNTDSLLASNRTVDMNGNFLKVQLGGENFLWIRPETDNEQSMLRAFNATAGDNISEITAGTTNNNANFLLQTSFDGGAKLSQIQGIVEATTSTLTLASDSVLINSTLSGAVTGYVWTLKNAATGSGYWKVGSSYDTAGNGLTDSSGRVILGGLMYKNTSIATAGNSLTLSTSTSGGIPFQVSSTTGSAIVVGSSGSNAIYADGLVGVNANSSGNSAVTATGSSSATPIKAVGDGGTNIYMQSVYASTNTTETMLQIVRSSSGTAANNIASRIKFDIQATGGTSPEANTIVSKWTNATLATRISQLTFTGVDNTTTKDLATFSSDAGLVLNGSLALPYTAQTGTYQILATDYTINCTANTFTVTLPTAVGITGRIYFITNSGAGTITLATTSSQTFANVVATPTTLPLATLTGVVVQSNGANWLKVSSF